MNGIQCNFCCNCRGCFNDSLPEHAMSRKAAILSTLESNPNAFRPNVPLQLEKAFEKGSPYTPSVAVAAAASGKSSAIVKSKSTNNACSEVAKPNSPTSPPHDSQGLWSRNEPEGGSPKTMAASAATSKPRSPSKKPSQILVGSKEDLRLGCSCKKSQCLKVCVLVL